MLHPVPRLAALVIAVVGAIISDRAAFLAIGWIVGLVPLLILAGAFVHHARFILLVLAPIAAMLFLVWGLLVAAPPGAPLSSDPGGGLTFAARTCFRLAFLGGAFQLCFLTIPPDRLATTLRQWGLRGDLLIVVLAAYVLGPEMRLRANQIVESRLACGLIPSRSIWSMLRNFPAMMIPLFAWAMRSAVHRADEWNRRRLTESIEALASKSDRTSRLVGISIVLLATAWAVANIWSRVAAG